MQSPTNVNSDKLGDLSDYTQFLVKYRRETKFCRTKSNLLYFDDGHRIVKLATLDPTIYRDITLNQLPTHIVLNSPVCGQYFFYYKSWDEFDASGRETLVRHSYVIRWTVMRHTTHSTHDTLLPVLNDIIIDNTTIQ